jgi:predicted transcriptional regulator
VTREKLNCSVTVKLPDELQQALDLYVERRSREARVVLSRSQALREIIESSEHLRDFLGARSS